MYQILSDCKFITDEDDEIQNIKMFSDVPDLIFDGSTAMGACHRAVDWSSTPLGAPKAWPEGLRTLVPIMLSSNQPMFIVWGAQRTLLYNDAYAELLEEKHPHALGGDFLEVWHEIRDDLGVCAAERFAG